MAATDPLKNPPPSARPGRPTAPTPGMDDHRRARRLIGASSAIFFTGLMISAAFFYSGRRLDWTTAIISDLQAPEENPRGYLASALATAVTGVLFVRLLAILHRQSCVRSGPLVWAGSVCFGGGALGAVAIGCLAPLPLSYDTVHVPLAFATFIALVAGAGLYLFLAGRQTWPLDRRRGALLYWCCGVIVAIIAALAVIYRHEDFFTGESLLTTLVLWEWLLCASIVGFLLVLAKTLEWLDRQSGLQPRLR